MFLSKMGLLVSKTPSYPQGTIFRIFFHLHRNTENGPQHCFYLPRHVSGTKDGKWEMRIKHSHEVHDNDKKTRLANNKVGYWRTFCSSFAAVAAQPRICNPTLLMLCITRRTHLGLEVKFDVKTSQTREGKMFSLENVFF